MPQCPRVQALRIVATAAADLRPDPGDFFCP